MYPSSVSYSLLQGLGNIAEENTANQTWKGSTTYLVTPQTKQLNQVQIIRCGMGRQHNKHSSVIVLCFTVLTNFRQIPPSPRETRVVMDGALEHLESSGTQVLTEGISCMQVMHRKEQR